MAFRSSSVNATLGDPLVLTKPAGTADNDILINTLSGPLNFTISSAPSGYAELTGSPQNGNDWGSMGARVHTKKAASEGANYSWDTSSQVIGALLAFSGRDPTNYLHRSSATKGQAASPWAATSLAFSSVTDEICDGIVIIIESFDPASGAPAHDTPAGWTRQVHIANTAAGSKAITIYYQDNIAAGWNGVLAITGTHAGGGADWSAFAVALLGASSPATGNPYYAYAQQ